MQREKGFSLIELMVAMTIALLFTIAIGQVMSSTESSRRTATSVGDIDQVGAYAIYQLDKLISNAGAGFVHSRNLSFGCQVNAKKGGTDILPAPAALPAPFSGIVATIGAFRVAPVVIVSNGSGFATGASDTLIVMSGSAGFGDVETTFQSAPSTSVLTLVNILGFSNKDEATTYAAAGDLVLLVDQPSASSHDCLIEQVAPSTDTTGGGNSLQLDTGAQSNPSYYTTAGSTVGLSGGFSQDGAAIDIGNPAAATAPLFQLIGVKEGSTTDNYSLFSYDLLQINNAGNASAIADEVFELHALYQVDTTATADGIPDAWVSPDPAKTVKVLGVSYDAATLLSGTTAAADALYRIKAVRVGLILRTALREKDIVSPDTLNLFQDLTDANGASLTYSRALSDDERHYRYKTLEATIPVRNNLY
jgi:type IV pilus assembly protein PilW